MTASSIQLGGVLRDIPAMAVGDWIGAEQSNRPDASQQGVAVVSERALERTRESSLPETLSDKQVHTTHQETRAATQTNKTWCMCHDRSYDGTREVSLAIGRVKTRFHALKILTSGGRYQSGDRRRFPDYCSQNSTNQ